MILTLRFERKRESGDWKRQFMSIQTKLKKQEESLRDAEEQSSRSAAVCWQGCLNPRELDLNFLWNMIPRQSWRQARPENQESRPEIQEFQS